jgi:glycerophosphoryl diester phosphodiesterase
VPPPLVYAHRGGAALRPENTIAAFDYGLALGAHGLELDVRLTRDDEVVVHHDATLERTTDGRGRVSAYTASDLAALDAGFRFTPRDGAGDGSSPFRGQGIRIPTLAEVLGRYPGVPIIIELKEDTERLAVRALEVVARADASAHVAMGSFGGGVLRAVRQRAPEMRTGAGREETRWALYRSWIGLPIGRPRYREFQVPEVSGRTRVVSRRFIQYAHRAGVAVNVWTVDEAADIERLLDWGVDGIISDRPDVAVRVLSARATPRS